MVPERIKRPRSVSLVVACLGYVALAAWSIWGIVEASGNPRNYYTFRNNTAGFVYPIDSVIESSCAVAVELVAILVFLRLARRTSPGVRLLAVVFLSALVIAVIGYGAMHAPPYYGLHLAWLLVAGAWSFVTAIAAAIEQSARSDRNPSTTQRT